MLDAENMHIVKSVDPGQPAHTGSLSWDNTFCRVWIIIMCCKQYFLLHVTSGRWVCKDLSSHLHYVADNKVCWGKLCSEWSFFCYLFTLVKSCCSFSLSYIFSVTCFHVAQFLARLAVGQRAYVMVRCPLCIRPCVIFFFKHLLLWNYLSDFDEISQKFSRHGPLQNFLKEFDSIKNCGCHGNKTEKKLKTLKIFLSETIRVRVTKFGM